MSTIGEQLEDQLRAVLRDGVFLEAWANYVDAMSPRPDDWEQRWRAARTIVAALYPDLMRRVVFGADVWRRILLEEALVR